MTENEFQHRVRALERGLNLLVILNQFNGLGIPDLTAKTGLTRSSVYRVLATLIQADYVFKSPSDNLYRVTGKVRDLSSGYEPDPWVKRVAAPIMDKMGEQLAWPLSLVTLRNRQLVTIHNTDRESALLVRRTSAGTTIPVSGTAVGQVFLTFGDPEVAEALKRSTLSTEQRMFEQDDVDLDVLERWISESRSRGYCIYQLNGFRALAVPVYRDGEVYAALGIRSSTDDPWPPEDDQKYLPALIETAKRLSAAEADF